jgi:hypothetical protein
MKYQRPLWVWYVARIKIHGMHTKFLWAKGFRRSSRRREDNINMDLKLSELEPSIVLTGIFKNKKKMSRRRIKEEKEKNEKIK